MKSTAHAYLENESFKAVMEVKKSISEYKEAECAFLREEKTLKDSEMLKR